MLLNDVQPLAQSFGLETENSPEQGIFARFEQKVFLPKKNAAQFRERLLKHMSPSYPVPGIQFTGVESVYFDSPDFRIYQTHFSSQRERFKIRTRRYAPNGVAEGGGAQLELKSKKAGVSRKTRFRIGEQEREILWSGGPVPASSGGLQSRNQDLTARQLEERIERINSLVQKNGLRPSCIVRYRREAFESGNLRLTIDDEIGFETALGVAGLRSAFRSNPKLREDAQRMRSAFRSGEFLLVEVKHPGTVPFWLTELLAAADCRKAKFSKYCYCVTEALLREA